MKINKHKESKLTHEYLKSALNYNDETGVFRWRAGKKKFYIAGDIAGRHSLGYLVIRLLGYSYQAHRLAYFYVKGVWPDGEIDHINHIKDDNSFGNLRVVDRTGNCRNNRLAKNSTSGFNGVYFNKTARKWQAHITVNNRGIYLGRFDDIAEAVKAREAADIKYGFHRNHGLRHELKSINRS